MTEKVTPFNKPFIIGKEITYIQDCIEHGHLSGNGLFTARCNRFIENQLGSGKSFMTPSCTASLELAALLLDIQPGDEVIMPSFTFVSTANAVALRGGVPVFGEIRSDSLNLDESRLEEYLSPRTKAIFPVHYAGNSCDMQAISTFAKKHGLYVVEDAAQAFGSTFKGKPVGVVGDMSCFSFHETKNVICGEGGALVVNNKKFVERAEILQEKGTNRSQFFRGQVDKYTWVDVGSSFLPSELQMAFLYAQFECADAITQKREQLCRYYRARLESLEDKFIQLPKVIGDCQNNSHIFYILCSDLKTRNELMTHLKKRGILAVFHYVPLHSSPAGLRLGKTPVALPVTNKISERLLRLPLYYTLTRQQQDIIIDAIYAFYGVG